MRATSTAAPLYFLSAFERHLVKRHNLPNHMARTLQDIRGGHR
ncbi:hypothetical protein DSM107133_02618 [Pseudosulfitobacter sp. DSM 107133]|nr:hypothetical protein DSM107133_02618 [Pseudosulfitobacter sp. DSM 107133]